MTLNLRVNLSLFTNLSLTKNKSSSSNGNAADEIQCVIKLYAESDQRQKLIGILNFPVNWQKEPFIGLDMHTIPYKKCVDSSAVIVLSTKIIQPKAAQQAATKQSIELAMRQVQRLQKLQSIQKINSLTTHASEPLDLENECDSIVINDERDRSQTHRQHPSSQGTPVKKGALASMNKEASGVQSAILRPNSSSNLTQNRKKKGLQEFLVSSFDKSYETKQQPSQNKLSDLSLTIESRKTGDRNHNTQRPLFLTKQSSAYSMTPIVLSETQVSVQDSLVSTLQQEIDCLKREKIFIQSKLSQQEDYETQIELEKQRANKSETAYTQLRAEIDLIQEHLTVETQNIEKQCRKFLELDEVQKLNERDASSPQSSCIENCSSQQLTVSEQILMKYKRSIELRQFFESKYQAQQRTIQDLVSDLTCAEQTIIRRNAEINDLEISLKQRDAEIKSLREQQQLKLNQLQEESNTYNLEKEFLTNEVNQTHLLNADFKAKLAKRTDELNLLKDGLNRQISELHGAFEEKVNSQQKTIEQQKLVLQNKDEQLQRIQASIQVLEEEKGNLSAMLNRQRDVLKSTNDELVETQSRAADLEERLIQTESKLINCKEKWAECELQRESLKQKVLEFQEICGINSSSSSFQLL